MRGEKENHVRKNGSMKENDRRRKRKKILDRKREKIFTWEKK